MPARILTCGEALGLGADCANPVTQVGKWTVAFSGMDACLLAPERQLIIYKSFRFSKPFLPLCA
jgi:hypothetical protein